MCRYGCFQGEHGIKRTRERVVDDGRWAVAGVVKTCSDGASNVCFLKGSCMFLSGCLSHMQS